MWRARLVGGHSDAVLGALLRVAATWKNRRHKVYPIETDLDISS
jgi:hypothetical protein